MLLRLAQRVDHHFHLAPPAQMLQMLQRVSVDRSFASRSLREGELGGVAARRNQGLKYFWSQRTILSEKQSVAAMLCSFQWYPTLERGACALPCTANALCKCPSCQHSRCQSLLPSCSTPLLLPRSYSPLTFLFVVCHCQVVLVRGSFFVWCLLSLSRWRVNCESTSIM